MNNTNLLSLLNDITETTSFDIFIPTLQREVTFKPLTTKQQKGFFTCIKDNIIYNTRFVMLTHNIIKENCKEPEILNLLTVLDKEVILLALRKNALGSYIKTSGVNISIDSCLEYSKTITLPANEEIIYNNIKIELQPALMMDQYNMEEELRGTLKDEKLTLTAIASDIVLNSLCKIIKNMWVNKNGEFININYSEYNYKDRITLLENLPYSFLEKIQEYSTKITIVQNKLKEVAFDSATTVRVSIDTDFFLTG